MRNNARLARILQFFVPLRSPMDFGCVSSLATVFCSLLNEVPILPMRDVLLHSCRSQTSSGGSSSHRTHSSLDNSARTLEHLLEAVLAIRVCLLQVVLLLVQIRHLLGQRLALSLQSLLYIRNGCEDEPVTSL